MNDRASFTPAYLELLSTGALQERVALALARMADCNLCPRNCRVDRLTNPHAGFCKTGPDAIICSYGPHHGEEAPLVGRRGSGTIFFSRCNLSCCFCQNWEISQRGDGRVVSTRELADIMLGLQSMGCHNINLVSPSHVIAPFLSALFDAAGRGLRLPVVYNTGGYDSLEALKLLDGVIDIYMPDMKFAESRIASVYLGVPDYAEVNQVAVKELFRQVGHLQLSETGLARRGLMIRHLVLPDDLADSRSTFRFIARELGQGTYLNLMDQYRPCYHASQHPPLDRRPTATELSLARQWALAEGLLCETVN